MVCFVCVFIVTNSCAALQETSTTPNITKKNVHIAYFIKTEEFTFQQERMIHLAAEHMNAQLACVFLERTHAYVPRIMLLIEKMPRPVLNKKTGGYIIGYFKTRGYKVQLSTLRKGTKKSSGFIPIEDDYFFKLAVHEFAHALGMRGHAFSIESKNTSQLSPHIGEKSKPELYPKDIEFLNHLLCGVEK